MLGPLVRRIASLMCELNLFRNLFVSFHFRKIMFRHFKLSFSEIKSASHCWLFSFRCILTMLWKTIFSGNRTVFARPGGVDLASNDASWQRVLSVSTADMNVYTFHNDLALAKIETGHQQVIRRARLEPPNNAECLIYGYGARSYDNFGVTSNSIRYGRVNTISPVECVRILGRVTAPAGGTGQFCAHSGSGVDACNGE